MKKRLVIGFLTTIMVVLSANAEKFRWLYNLTFEAPENSKVLYSSRDRLEMIVEDMTFVVQVFSSEGVNDDVLKQNLHRRAMEYNMYDTRVKKFSLSTLKGYRLNGVLPDGSIADIHNVISTKTGICVQYIVNYVGVDAKKAVKLAKSVKEESEKAPKSKRKQKIQKKNAPLKPIKKTSTLPVELYEI